MKNIMKFISKLNNFLADIGMIILIVAIGFGAQILNVDFEQNTGNLLFPKISRGRLMTGRLIANALLIFLEISIY